MIDVLKSIDDHYVREVLEDQQNVISILKRKQTAEVPFHSAFNIWSVSSHYIHRI